MKLLRSPMFLPVIIMVFAVFLSVIILNVRTSEYNRWQPADGILQKRVQLHSLKDRIYYTFIVDGTEHDSSDVIHRHIHTPPVGSAITVWYDTDDYRRTSYNSKPSAEFDSWAPFFIAVPLSCAMLLTNLQRNRNSIE